MSARDKIMSKKPQARDEALEALDFIVNVLKEHENDLDRLIGELGTVTEQMGETGELTCKVENVEEKISGLQNEISGLVNYLSKEPTKTSSVDNKELIETAPSKIVQGPPVILRCKKWDDFQTLASNAQTVSFMYKEVEKTFQVDALKGNQIITYNGSIPNFDNLLKMWLSKQLEIPEKQILEGVLAIG
jgi:hypothetical protein